MKKMIVSILMILAPIFSGMANQETLWRAVCEEESRTRPTEYNKDEEAAGIAQIRPILIRCLNMNANGGREKWSLEDRWCPEKSREMFFEYTDYWASRRGLSGTDEERARIWNGGPRGHLKDSTIGYWVRVKAIIERMGEE